MMTLEDIYEFDLRGYIIYRNVLSLEEVDRIRNILVNVKEAKYDGKFSFIELDPYFVELMANPYTLGILQTILGKWLRFDHAFGIKMTKDIGISENLHAGPLQNQRAFWYQWVPGQGMHNGLVKVIYALNDVNHGDGGFICVPSSHKGNANYCPQHDSHLVINPTMKSGDMLIFTEALIHGSRQWTADRTRIALIYSYALGFVAWKSYDTIEPYLSLATNDIQRDLLRPPYVGNYDEHKAERTGEWDKKRRTPTVI
jgi:Phytanoyl-CoA dioxygenase (PhyH)